MHAAANYLSISRPCPLRAKHRLMYSWVKQTSASEDHQNSVVCMTQVVSSGKTQAEQWDKT